MLTIATTLKPCRGHSGVIQRNALESWMRLRPWCDVIVFGDEEGVGELAAGVGCRHVPDVARNEFGMPLVGHVFEHTRQLAATPLLGYANGDIIFMHDFIEAVRQLVRLADRFLMIGQRCDVDVGEPLDFSPQWEARLRDRVIGRGLSLTWGMDYFVFPRDLWTGIPGTLAIGRAGWDNWPVYAARLHGAMVVDATPVVMAVHQQHDYALLADGRKGAYDSAESRRNYATLGGARNVLTIMDATHILTEAGPRIRCRSCYPLCVCRPASF